MIGDYVKLKERQLNYSTKELAQKCNISYTLLNLIEHNKRKISKNLIPIMAKNLKVEEDELKYYNTITKENGLKAEKRLAVAQLNEITNRIAEIEVERELLNIKKTNILTYIAEIDEKERAEIKC